MEIIFTIAMITGAFCYYQNNKISITNLKVDCKVNSKIRIVQISDLHSKEFGKNNNTLYKIGLAEKRVDKGEMFYSKVNSRYEIDNADSLFRKLEKLIGVKIILSHYPENYEYIGENSYSKYNFDIMFSGHAHGGQFILPGIGGIFAPGQGLFPKYYRGIYGEKSKLVVSRGLGNSGFPLRLFNRPDLVVVDIINKKIK